MVGDEFLGIEHAQSRSRSALTFVGGLGEMLGGPGDFRSSGVGPGSGDRPRGSRSSASIGPGGSTFGILASRSLRSASRSPAAWRARPGRPSTVGSSSAGRRSSRRGRRSPFRAWRSTSPVSSPCPRFATPRDVAGPLVEPAVPCGRSGRRASCRSGGRSTGAGWARSTVEQSQLISRVERPKTRAANSPPFLPRNARAALGTDRPLFEAGRGRPDGQLGGAGGRLRRPRRSPPRPGAGGRRPG